MSVYSDIDSTTRQIDALIAESKKPVTPPPPPPPKGDKQTVVQKVEQNGGDSTDTTAQTTSTGSGSDQSSGSDSNQVSVTSAGENTFTGMVSAVGQNLTKSFNEKVLPELKKVDPKVYWAVGGTAVLLIIINANRQ